LALALNSVSISINVDPSTRQTGSHGISQGACHVTSIR
jgi:hypothetical protein